MERPMSDTFTDTDPFYAVKYTDNLNRRYTEKFSFKDQRWGDARKRAFAAADRAFELNMYGVTVCRVTTLDVGWEPSDVPDAPDDTHVLNL